MEQGILEKVNEIGIEQGQPLIAENFHYDWRSEDMENIVEELIVNEENYVVENVDNVEKDEIISLIYLIDWLEIIPDLEII